MKLLRFYVGEEVVDTAPMTDLFDEGDPRAALVDGVDVFDLCEEPLPQAPEEVVAEESAEDDVEYDEDDYGEDEDYEVDAEPPAESVGMSGDEPLPVTAPPATEPSEVVVPPDATEPPVVVTAPVATEPTVTVTP